MGRGKQSIPYFPPVVSSEPETAMLYQKPLGLASRILDNTRLPLGRSDVSLGRGLLYPGIQ